MCYLVIHSTMKDNIQVVTVRERFCFTNCTSLPVGIKCFAMPLSSSKVGQHEHISPLKFSQTELIYYLWDPAHH